MNQKSDSPVYLVLNCSEAVLQVVLGCPDSVLWSQTILTPGRAMKHIAPAIKAGMDCLEIRPELLAGISCVHGPGSFTGIRMIYAHAHGLSLAANIPMASISYFDALIHGPGKLLNGPAWIFVHSRKKQVYAAGFSLPGLNPVFIPSNIRVNDIHNLIRPEPDKTVHVFGSGVRKNPECFTSCLLNILPPKWDTPQAESLLELSLNAHYSSSPVFPEYLRPSDAEERFLGFDSKP